MICPNCVRPFEPANRLFKHGQTYCSAFCRTQSYITPMFKKTRECADCQAIFVPTNKGGQKVCRKCAKKHGNKPLKPIFKICQIKSCKKQFKASVYQERFCRIPPCPSAAFSKNRKNAIKMSYSSGERLDKKAACKLVVCDVMDVYFKDVIAEHPLATMERLKEIKNEMLAGHCGEFINRKGLAAAVFYVASGISQLEVASLFGVSEITLRKYTKWWKHDIPFTVGEKRKRVKSTKIQAHAVKRGKMEKPKIGRPMTKLPRKKKYMAVKGNCDECGDLSALYKVPAPLKGGFGYFCERCKKSI